MSFLRLSGLGFNFFSLKYSKLVSIDYPLTNQVTYYLLSFISDFLCMFCFCMKKFWTSKVFVNSTLTRIRSSKRNPSQKTDRLIPRKYLGKISFRFLSRIYYLFNLCIRKIKFNEYCYCKWGFFLTKNIDL